MRAGLVFHHFFGSFRSELEDLAIELLAWVDSCFAWPFTTTAPEGTTATNTPGHRLTAFIVGLGALKAIRVW